jgi:acetylornithine deacetylase/succinyl-diaminopimelate desuccinylase-like protein
VAESPVPSRLRGDLVLEAVVGEEMMEHELGTSACIARGYRADAAVVAEPSGPPDRLAVVPVTSGILSFTLAVEGKATHATMRGETITAGGYGAEVGVSAIDKAFDLYAALRELERRWAETKRHPLYRPGHFAIYPGVVVGGPTSGLVPFFIADAARIEYVVIHHPGEDAADVRAEIERHVERAAGTDPWLREHPPTVTWNHAWPQSVVADDHPIVAETAAAHTRASGEAARLRGFAAVDDAAFLTAAGIPAITYGPGDLRVAHAVDEHVEVAELATAARTYALLAASWCG